MMEWLTRISIEQAAALTAIAATLAGGAAAALRYLRRPAPPRLNVEIQVQPALRWRGWFLVTLAIRNTQGSTVDVLAVEALRHPKDLIERARYERPILLGDPSGVVWPDNPPSFAPQRADLGLTLKADQTAKPLRLYLFVGPAITGRAIQRSIWLHWKSRTSSGAPIRQRIDF